MKSNINQCQFQKDERLQNSIHLTEENSLTSKEIDKSFQLDNSLKKTGPTQFKSQISEELERLMKEKLDCSSDFIFKNSLICNSQQQLIFSNIPTIRKELILLNECREKLLQAQNSSNKINTSNEIKNTKAQISLKEDLYPVSDIQEELKIQK